ncbi:glycosyltransferase [Pseudonocardia sp. MH-G8]|uniref:glycosyltransferase n=1 Tax=Pseudonocardia sp. MH-G8 TaxID=1854588 RepID=UPI000BA0C40E|nr:glycosyltransferase [Pseudonocardia sp. MH-G8]OZM79875.1 UDP-glucose--sterol glucosyltransferase [Pseudonocardia sp. MH-G8]
MEILIGAAGTMGDVAPFTGLGLRLQSAGHRVAVAAFEPFGDHVTGAGLEFRPLPGDPTQNARSRENRRWEQGRDGAIGAVRLVRLLARILPDMNAGFLDAARRGADLILLSQVSGLGGYDIARGVGIPSAGVYVAPVHPTGDFPPPVGVPSMGRFLNRWAGQLLQGAGSAPFARAIARTQDELGRPHRGPGALLAEQAAQDWPVFYGFSPRVIPRPADWRPGIRVCGYFWPPVPKGWTPDPVLTEFLAAGPPPVFVGFGSLAASHGERLSTLVREAVRRAGVRAVVQAGWAGLHVADDDVLTVGHVPHEWLFPRSAAIVHHAGAGTTGAALRAGVPQVPVPVAADQPFWAGRVERLGVSPGALPFRTLTAGRLAAALAAVHRDTAYRERAVALAAGIATEDGAGRVVEAVEQLRA